MTRTLVLAAVCAAYAAVLMPPSTWRLTGASPFDPLSPRPREIEELIVAGRFADALPIAVELQRAYPEEALVAYWLAAINRGLARPDAEAAAWEVYVRRSHAPAEACPAWPDAYTRLGQLDRARAAAERCAAFEQP